MNILSPAQCRAARALLNWSQPDLATRADVHVQTISNFEKEQSSPSKTTLEKLCGILEDEGIIFLGEDGVRMRQLPVRQYQGTDGFRAFMDDLYTTMNKHGGEMCLLNSHPDLWIKWLGGRDWYENVHQPRMEAISDRIHLRITTFEGNTNFLAKHFAEYRVVPETMWNDNGFYCFADRIALMNFTDKNVEIFVIKNRKFAETFRFLFNLYWDKHATGPGIGKPRPQTPLPGKPAKTKKK